MIKQIYELNIIPDGKQIVINTSQYDKGSRIIECYLYRGKKTNIFDISEYERKNGTKCSVYVVGTKQDKTGYMYPCLFEKNKVVFDIKQQMSVLPGQHDAEIRVEDSEHNLICSANFCINVEPTALKDDTIISETELPIIEEIVENADSIKAVETILKGGLKGQVLSKKSDEDGDTEWKDVAGGNAEWGNISGTLSNQTDLQNALNLKANDDNVLHKTGDEDISGIKTFENQSIFIGETNGCDAILVGNGAVTMGIGVDGISLNGDTENHGFIAFPDTTQILPGKYKEFATTDQIPTSTSQLENNSGFIDKDVNNLTNYTLSVGVGAIIDVSIDTLTYVMTIALKNAQGATLSTDSIDLPLETMVVGATYDNTNKKIILTLQSGQTVDVPVGDLVAGLQTEITAQNMLSSDYVDDTNKVHKFVSAQEKQDWNGKVDDVQVNGTSVVSSGVANIPVANDSSFGVIKVNNSSNGLRVTSDGVLSTVRADNTQIAGKSNEYRMIVPSNLDYAIEQGLGNNALTWTEQEKASARATIGAISLADLPIYNGGVQ